MLIVCVVIYDFIHYSIYSPYLCRLMIGVSCHLYSTHQIAQQGLTPDMAIRACNNPEITGDKLSRALREPILRRAKMEVKMIREHEEEKKEEEDGGADAVAMAPSKTPSSSKRRRMSAPARVSTTSAASASSTTPTGRKRSASISILSKFDEHNLSAPYLKNKTTHFQKKVKKKREELLKKDPPPEKQASKTAEVVSTRQTGHQQNAEWRNQKSHDEDVGYRYKMAIKEATQAFADKMSGKDKSGRTQQQIVDYLNHKWNLDGEGKEDSREKEMLTVRTVRRAVEQGRIGTSPQKKGAKPKISRDFLRLVALHANMEQVGPRGEMNASEIKGVLVGSVLETEHENQFNYDWAWEECRRLNADILIPTGVKQAEDIRWIWVTYEKLNQYLTDKKVRFLFPSSYFP